MGRRVSSANRGNIAQLDGSGKYEKRSHRQGETKGVRSAWESKFEVGFLTLSILSYNTLTTAEVVNWGEADHLYICGRRWHRGTKLCHLQPHTRREFPDTPEKPSYNSIYILTIYFVAARAKLTV